MMQNDPFGDLQEWNVVLDQLDAIERAGGFDEVQPGLVRLIRYRQNWQLRERALKAARSVQRPMPALLQVASAVVADCETYPDARILAARALADLTPRAVSTGMPGEFDPDAVPVLLEQQLGIPEAPIVQQAMRDALNRVTNALQVPA